MQNELAIQVNNITHYYGKVRALNKVSLTIPKNATVGLVGPDGVGKSTLLSLIAGVKIIQQGDISVLEQNIKSKTSRLLLSHKVAFMPQGLGKNLYFSLSVFENIDCFARLYGLNEEERKSRIERLLSATNLTPFKNRPAGKLSGGMKQKLSLCCALVHNPEILILDEPTTGVDPLSRRQFWKLINSLREETNNNMTVIVSTAYTEEAGQFEYLMAMDDGKILIHDLTQRVLEKTKSKSVEEAYIKLLPEEKKPKTQVIIPDFKADPNQPYAIEAYGLTKKFNDFTAVDNVSFQISKGEIFGFLGSNGCGKSTTMKMLTGLLESTEGSAKLLGNPVNATDITTRMRVGYMSQSFSLYQELTVSQNLKLHAQLYYIPKEEITTYVNKSLEQFELSNYANMTPNQLSLGIKQRLQLAAACLHNPEVLILDEPTSGVDPAARDMFWNYLIDLSRNKKVTIFVSTHFMNEAGLCDRISLMDKGKVLAVGKPEQLVENINAKNLEDAFIQYLEQNLTPNDDNYQTNQPRHEQINNQQSQHNKKELSSLQYWLASFIAFARRESMELLRDQIRMAFAILGPLIILICATFSVSFDVEKITFTVLDLDRSAESSKLIELFSGSRYFKQVFAIKHLQDIDNGMRKRAFEVAIVIPDNFGQKVLTQQKPELSFYLNAASPFRASVASSYISVLHNQFQNELIRYLPQSDLIKLASNIIEPRFMYNQSFKSIFTIVPGVIMLVLMIIPTILTSLSVVREKEMGSIINLYASPSSVSPYLLGKLTPYIILELLTFICLLFFSIFILQLPVKGSLIGYFIGTIFYIFASGTLGLFISCFLNSQVAAIFTAVIFTLIPAINFSGLLYPVSTLSGISYFIGMHYPASWYQIISLGAFTKGLNIIDFISMYMRLIIFSFIFMLLACLSLKKQEK